MKRETKLGRAVVIGGSMGGLLAARAISESYTDVVIVERDDISSEGVYRKGVPQARHAHAILAGGYQVIEEMFPGLSDELVSRGALVRDPLNDGRWVFEGDDLKRTPSGTQALLLSRPLLEDGIRRRVREIDGIRILDNRSVRELITKAKCVAGIVTDEEAIEADLVVDAAGRGSHASQWIKSLGFEQPREEKVNVQLFYTTRIFRRESRHMNGEAFVSIPSTPEGKRGGVVLAQEGDEWIVTLTGNFGHQAPEDLDGFIEYAATLPAKHIYELVRNAEPIGDAITMRYPASVRRRYEELNSMPDGFLAFGDAICSFNPVYGQGMSSAAQQARELRNALASGNKDLARRFYRAAGKVIDIPWSIAVGTDLQMPETGARRTVDVRIINWYMSKLHQRGHTRSDAAIAFIRVAQLLDPPTALMRPLLAARVIWSWICRALRTNGSKREPLVTSADRSRHVHDSGF